MSRIINLRQMRKQKARDENRAQADANAAKFGEAKAPRVTRKANQDRDARILDAHKRDD